jgi:hypothetical protein
MDDRPIGRRLGIWANYLWRWIRTPAGLILFGIFISYVLMLLEDRYIPFKISFPIHILILVFIIAMGIISLCSRDRDRINVLRYNMAGGYNQIGVWTWFLIGISITIGVVFGFLSIIFLRPNLCNFFIITFLI